jgi:hypothetical protein
MATYNTVKSNVKANGMAIGNPSGGPLFDGTGGTAVVYHDPSDHASLLALRGQILPEWSAVYPPGPAAMALTFGREKLRNCAGYTGVKFSRVRVLDVTRVLGAVEVTLEYGAAQRTGHGILPGGGKQGQTSALNTSRSNVKNN